MRTVLLRTKEMDLRALRDKMLHKVGELCVAGQGAIAEGIALVALATSFMLL